MADVLSAAAQYVAVGIASAKFTNAMAPGIVHRYVANTDSWVKVTATGGAAAADTANNHFVPSGQSIYLVNRNRPANDPSAAISIARLCASIGGARWHTEVSGPSMKHEASSERGAAAA